MRTKALLITTAAILLTIVSNKPCFAGYSWSFEETNFTVAPGSPVVIHATFHAIEGTSDQIFNIGLHVPPTTQPQYYKIQQGDFSEPGFSPSDGQTFVFATLYPIEEQVGQTYSYTGSIVWWDPGKRTDGTYRINTEKHSFQFTVAEPFCGDESINQDSEECDGTDGIGDYQECSDTCELIDIPYEECSGVALDHSIEAPTVSVHATDTEIFVDEKVNVIVSGSSEVCLASVWWFVEDTNDTSWHHVPGTVDGTSKNLMAAQYFGAGSGKTSYTNEPGNSVTFSEPGIYAVTANSRDMLYPTPGEAHQASEGNGMEVFYITVLPRPYCGDDIKNAEEECDGNDGVIEGKSCTDACTLYDLPIDGGWNDFSSFGECSATCGGGEQSQTRTCTNPAPQFGGADCIGSAENIQACNVHSCPINGGWSGWGEFGECSATCGGGEQSQIRICANPAPQYGGAYCYGASENIQACNEQACPIDGGWSEFSAFDGCSATCGGGEQSQTRACTNPAPQFGGADCVGSAENIEACNEQACPIDGGWSDFSAFDECSATCGGGEQAQTRACTNPEPQFGGADCVGSVENIQACNEQACPIDGGWSDFSAFDECSATCGGGEQAQTRACTNPEPQFGGADCVGSVENIQACNEQACTFCGDGIINNDEECDGSEGINKNQSCTDQCKILNNEKTEKNKKVTICHQPKRKHKKAHTITVSINALDAHLAHGDKIGECSSDEDPQPYCGDKIKNADEDCDGTDGVIEGKGCTDACTLYDLPIDGSWSDFSEFGECSATCGGGEQAQTRACTNPEPQFGGADCVGSAENIEACNEQACPIAGGWSDFSEFGECSATCGGGEQTQSRTCTNPEPQFDGADCVGSAENIEACNEQACPIAGGWSDFSEFGECSATCGGGEQTQSRTCTNPEPQFDGADCVGSTENIQACNEQACEFCGDDIKNAEEECDGADGVGDYQECSDTCELIDIPYEECSGVILDHLIEAPTVSVHATDNEIYVDESVKVIVSGSSEVCLASVWWFVEDTNDTSWHTIPGTVNGTPKNLMAAQYFGAGKNQTSYTNAPGHTLMFSEPGVYAVKANSRDILYPISREAHQASEGNGIEVFYITVLDRPIAGGWSDFTEFGECSETCGGGEQTQTRTCTNPEPQFGGADCVGSVENIQACNEQACPIDGGWSDFTEFGECSETCGGGEQTQTRTCTNPEPQFGGADCVGSTENIQACNEQACPIDGGWSDFTEFGECSETCGGGEQTQTRTCTNPEPQFGGADCVGSVENIQACNEQACPIDGGWSDFTEFGECSETCGGGEQTQTRTCTNPEPQFGGTDCVGSPENIQECNEQACPIDGGWGDFTEFGECSETCGGGEQTQTRTCTNPEPQFGGANCVGSTENIQACNEQACPIDGGWSDFTEFGECSETCGGGEQTQTRTCTNPEPQFGGADCVGSVENIQACNEQACPIAGGWSDFSEFGECSATCGGGEQTQSRTCTNPEPQFDGADCVGSTENIQACNEQACEFCGDGIANNGEECDGTDGVGDYQECSATCELIDLPYEECSGVLLDHLIEAPTVSVHATDNEIYVDESVKVIVSGSSEVCLASVWWFVEDTNDTSWHTIPGTVNGTPKNLMAAQYFGAGKNQTSYTNAPGHTLMFSEPGVYAVKANSRDKLYPIPGEAHQASEGNGIEVFYITVLNRPIDGGWGDFGAFDECSETCGGGEQTQTRTCTNPEPQFGGADCVGSPENIQECNEQSCPIAGGWSDFSAFDECSATCGGGEQIQTRACTNPEPQFGGADCVGSPENIQECNEQACPVDGGWSEFSSFDECSATCGGGEQTQSRTCTNPEPQFDGADCVGSPENIQECNEQACPVDGGWSEFSSFDECSATCGGGEQTQSRTCTNPEPQFDGADCVGSTENIQACNEQACEFCGDDIKNAEEECDGTDGVGDYQECSATCELIDLPYEECSGVLLDHLIEAPTVSVHATDNEIYVDESVKVIVSGSSEVCLASVWWFVEDTNDTSWHTIPGTVNGTPKNLMAAQYFGAGKNQTSYTNAPGHTLMFSEPGVYAVKANSRDILYPISREAHQASEGNGIEVFYITVLPRPSCGDDIKNAEEECDGTDGVGDYQECSSECELVDLPYCGDGIVQKHSSDILYDSFDPGDIYYTHGSRSATSPNQGNPSADNNVANGFINDSGADYLFESIEVALLYRTGPNELDVWLMGNNPEGNGGTIGTPDENNIIESFRLSNQTTGESIGSIVKIDSVLKPVLKAGSQYWIVLSVPEPNSQIAWWSAPIGGGGESTAIIAEKNSSWPEFSWRSYQVREGFALRVTGTLGEACDGISISSCNSDGYAGSISCQDDCTFSSCEQIEFCGDGILQTIALEQCDDGNDVSNDGCTSTCTTESCGDGIVNNNEECDDGYNTPGDGCSADCHNEYCGDGIITSNLYETCDSDYRVCSTLDGYSGTQFCMNDCSEYAGCTSDLFCGDGICSQAAENTTNCYSDCPNTCGDGNLEYGEDCDDGNIVSNDGCSNTCEEEFCGDGIVNYGEECDDGNLVSGDLCSENCERLYCEYLDVEIIKLTDNSYDDVDPMINNKGEIVWTGKISDNYSDIFYSDGTETRSLTDNGDYSNRIPYHDPNKYDHKPQINNNGVIVWISSGNVTGVTRYDGSKKKIIANNIVGGHPIQINDMGQMVWTGRDPVGSQTTEEGPDGDSVELFYYDGVSVSQITDNYCNDYTPKINDKGEVTWFVSTNREDGCPSEDWEVFKFDGTDISQVTNDFARDYEVTINNDGIAFVSVETDGLGNLIQTDGVSSYTISTDRPSAQRSIYSGKASYAINNHGNMAWFADNGYFYNGIDVEVISEGPRTIHTINLNENGIIVWSERVDGEDYEIMIYDGSKVYQITNNNFDDLLPEINNLNEVVWKGFDGNDYEIYKATLGCGLKNGVCGDGVVDTGEECDDGNTEDNDGCSSSCIQTACSDGANWSTEIIYDSPETLISLSSNTSGQLAFVSFKETSPDIQSYNLYLYDGDKINLIADDSYQPAFPDINDNGWVAFYSNHNRDFLSNEIYLYNGSSVTKITDNNLMDSGPKINNNNHITWTGSSNSVADQNIYYFNGSETYKLTDNSTQDILPDINNNNEIVWYDQGSYNIKYYNGSNIDVIGNVGIPNGENNFPPQISDSGHVIWPKRDYYSYLMYYNGSNVTQLTNSTNSTYYYRAINKNNSIVWQSDDNRILLYDDEEIKQIAGNEYGTKASNSLGIPSINDNGLIAWMENESIYFYDGNSSYKVRDNSNLSSSFMSAPILSDNHIYWTEYDGGTKLFKTTIGCGLENGVCGNGVVDTGEECDDGNTEDNDGCSSSCFISTSAFADPIVVATIPVGIYPEAVAITPNGQYAYVNNCESETVSAINVSTNTVVATIPVGVYPEGVAITPDGQYAYVANASSASSNSVSVINISTNTVVATIPVGYAPTSVAITPNGQYAYVNNVVSNSVSVINVSTNTVVATIPVGYNPKGVAITPDGQYAYVSNIGSNSVSVINVSTNIVDYTIAVSSGPLAVAITPDGQYAYVANSKSNTVAVINISTNTVVHTIAVGNEPWSVAITPDGQHAYVANAVSDNISVINISTNTVVYTVAVGNEPRSVAITPDGQHAYVTNSVSENVSVIATGISSN